MSALTRIQEQVLIAASLAFYHRRAFVLTDFPDSRVGNLQPYQTRDALNELVPLGLLEGPDVARNTSWVLTARGFILGDALYSIIVRKDELAKDAAKREFETPKPIKLTAFDRAHLLTIAAFVAEVQDEQITVNINGDGEYDCTGVFYASDKFRSCIPVNVPEVLAGKVDDRVTHVVLVFSNMEDK